MAVNGTSSARVEDSGLNVVKAFKARYLNRELSPIMFGWTPMVREPFQDTLEAWSEAAARVIDQLHTSGWLAGGVEQAVSQIVGTGLDINLQPTLDILGNQDETETWARRVEERFEQWSYDPYSCDLGGRYTLGQIATQGVVQYFATGEQVATLPFVDRPGSSHGIKVNLMPSSRLSQASKTPDGETMTIWQGVQVDQYGCPVGYLFENMDPVTKTIQEKVVRARDDFGRPSVIHLLDNGPGAYRGISPVVPALETLKEFGMLSKATLRAAQVQAIFAATIESDAPSVDLLKALQSEDEQEATAELDSARPGDFQNLMNNRVEWYKNTKFDLNEWGKMVHLFPGEKLTFNASKHPNDAFETHVKFLLREVARCLGITYEQFTGDYVGATYSSLRMGGADAWLLVLKRRSSFPARFYQITFEAWLEEDIIRGGTPFPGGVEAYLSQRRDVARIDWRGPPKPTADDLKTAKAQQIQRQEGWVPTEQLAAEYGNDHRDVIESQARTNELRETNKMDPLPSGGKLPPEPGDGGPDGVGAPGGAKEMEELADAHDF